MGGLEGPPKPPNARQRPGTAVALLDSPVAWQRPGTAVALLDSPCAWPRRQSRVSLALSTSERMSLTHPGKIGTSLSPGRGVLVGMGDAEGGRLVEGLGVDHEADGQAAVGEAARHAHRA